MTKNPLVSIIICTCNRAEHLRQTLAAMQNVEVPDGGCELIVVDNASTDSTVEVVKECLLPQITVRYIYEARRGKGYAYNSAIAAAKGEILLFTDDDVRPSSDWIRQMCVLIITDAADAVVGNVHIAPHLERSWMGASHLLWLASTDGLNSNTAIDLIGANMAFSKAVLSKVPQFDVELGPGALGFADESLFSYQLRQAGYRVKMAREAHVVHHFEVSRLSRASLVNRAINQGRSGAYVAHHWEHAEIPDVRLRVIKRALRLIYSRFLYHSECRTQEGISNWEMDIISSLAFYRYFATERHKPRNYEKYGLVKRIGAKGDALNNAQS